MNRKQALHNLVLVYFDKPSAFGLSWPEGFPHTAQIRGRELAFHRAWSSHKDAFRRSLDGGLGALLDEVLRCPESEGDDDLVAVGVLQAFIHSAMIVAIPECRPARVAIVFLDDPNRRFLQGVPIVPPSRRGL
jgi:hypothetical protein